MDKQKIADLVLGTYEHDLFKPFWLGGPRHSLLGYAFQRICRGKSHVYALAALLHESSGFQQYLQWHLTDVGVASPSLPKVLVLANWLDRISSASYSMYGEDERGRPNFKQFGSWKGSAQNVFSRLPVWEMDLFQGRVCSEKGDSGYYVDNLFQKPFLALQQSNTPWGLPNQANSVLKLLEEIADPSKTDVADSTTQQRFSQLVSDIQQLNPEQRKWVKLGVSFFGERTYPHANDTALQRHTQFAANLYHVLLSNLSSQRGLPEDLQKDLVGVGLEKLSNATIDDWQQNRLHDVFPLLSTYVCQIRLTGLEAYFTNAVRLDDLQGAKLLADRIRYRVKRQMCTAFGLGAQAEEAAFDGTRLADLLCISESRFTLTYLVPAALVENKEALPGLLYDCYQRALLDVVTKEYPPATQVEQRAPQSLLAFLRSDVRRSLVRDANGKNVTLQPSEAELLEGLELFLPTFAFAYVDGTPGVPSQLEEEYGKKLVIAYQQVQEDPGLMPATIQRQLQQMAAVEETIALCTSSGAARAWQALSNHAYGRPGHILVRQLLEYFHDFRGGAVEEPEEISQVVAAMRGLAHGVAQEEALTNMVKCEETGPFPPGGPEQLTLKYQDATKPPLPLPPLLQGQAKITKSDNLLDLNAAYVRIRSDNEPMDDPLIRFPSVTYAADRNSNVAMITLHPTVQVYEKQEFPTGFVHDVNGDGASFDLRGADGAALDQELQAYKDLYTYYFNLGGKGKEAALRQELMRIPAHLARVLQRQETITRFFGALHWRLQAAGVRSLKLEDCFPVGRYLVPADMVTRALEVLDRSICLDLLAVNGADLGLDDQEAMTNLATCNVLEANKLTKLNELHRFLCSYVPPILTGTTMLFKHKQALYLMLRAEERLRQQVTAAPVMAMGLIDLRGTLVDRGQLHGQYTFAGWQEIAKTVQQVDRHSLDALARDADWAQRWSTPSTEVNEAVQALVEARWQNRTKAAEARKRKMPKDLASKAKKSLRDAAYYLVRAQHSGEA